MTAKVRSQVATGVAVLTLDEPPANTYSYDMMRELDAAILEARMDASVHVIVLTGAGEKFFCAGATIGMLKEADARVQVLLLPSRQRDAQPARADAEARDRRAERAHGRRRARDRDGRRSAHCAEGRGQDRPAGSRARRAARHRRNAAARAARRQGSAMKLMIIGPPAVDGRGGRARARHRGLGCSAARRPAVRRRGHRSTRGRSRRRTRRAAPSVASSAPCSRARKPAFGEGLALERELQQLLFESDDAREGIAASLEKRKPKFSGS